MTDLKETNEESSDVPVPAKRRGRPPKKELEKHKPGGGRSVGRPKGDAAYINDFKARLLASPKSKKVLDKIFEAALDDEHKGQQAAWKLIADRIIPVSVFEQDIKRSGGKSAITINISGLSDSVSISGENTLDGEFENVSEEKDYANG
jgi:hypothetical protein